FKDPVNPNFAQLHQLTSLLIHGPKNPPNYLNNLNTMPPNIPVTTIGSANHNGSTSGGTGVFIVVSHGGSVAHNNSNPHNSNNNNNNTLPQHREPCPGTATTNSQLYTNSVTPSFYTHQDGTMWYIDVGSANFNYCSNGGTSGLTAVSHGGSLTHNSGNNSGNSTNPHHHREPCPGAATTNSHSYTNTVTPGFYTHQDGTMWYIDVTGNHIPVPRR
ncbi:hypothetical protein DM02DRAFT_690571, partial [Periconia macrospinosa]